MKVHTKLSKQCVYLHIDDNSSDYIPREDNSTYNFLMAYIKVHLLAKCPMDFNET